MNLYLNKAFNFSYKEWRGYIYVSTPAIYLRRAWQGKETRFQTDLSTSLTVVRHTFLRSTLNICLKVLGFTIEFNILSIERN